jgi:DNA repair protein SbcD/Mre11
MRFLHTADWHVGKTLRGRSRMDEHAAALDEVARIALEAKVDALLVAGDVFDSPAPPPEAEKLVYDFLARMLAGRVACVVIAGNHDHPKKLGALSALLEGLHIHVRPEVRPPADGGVVALASRDGSEQARIAVLPFVPERRVVDACAVMGPEAGWYEEYARRIEQILAALVKDLTPATVNVVLAHLLVDGARRGTGERDLHLGQAYGVNPQQLPASVQYIGLGHLHRPQEIAAPSKTCYAGSLVELDFGEQEQEKRVVVLEAKPGRPGALESVRVAAGRRLRDVSGTLDELRDQAEALAGAFLRVTVKAEAPVAGLADRVKELLPNALDVKTEFSEGSHPPPLPVARSSMDPLTLFGEYYKRRNDGQGMPQDLARLFAEIYEEAAR